MLMTKYGLKKIGLRPAPGQKPFAYTGKGVELYEKEKAVPVKTRSKKPNSLPKIDIEHYKNLAQGFADRFGPSTDTYQYIQKQLAKKVIIVKDYKDRVGVVLYGQRFDELKREIEVLFEDSPAQSETITNKYSLTYLYGSTRGIYTPLGVFVGKTSLMGSIARSIKSGRCFRGR